ncbi:MAG: hypothetical protein KF852_01770 [Saprospiraceae bacterium]|nr:hypothetical protein [Saprospiraceae bacterium]
MKILHTEPECYDKASLQLLESLGEVNYHNIQSKKQLLKLLDAQPYEALFIKLGIAIEKEVVQAAETLKFIITPTTGLDHIDLRETGERNIQVISLRGETEFLNTIHSTAEHTWGLLLALIRRIPYAFDSVQKGNWTRTPFLASELGGKVLGIIGYGRLGKIVAGYGAAFRMKVFVADNDEKQLKSLPPDIIAVSLEQLLQESDVISIHIPSIPPNYHFLNRERIALLKKGAILVNTSRGEVIEEKALLQALESNDLFGAALDVLEGDSSWEHTTPEAHPLLCYARQHDNLLITPHSGGYGQDSIYATRAFITRKFLKAIQY